MRRCGVQGPRRTDAQYSACSTRGDDASSSGMHAYHGAGGSVHTSISAEIDVGTHSCSDPD